MQKNKTFDITIPVLNEEETLEQNVRILHTFIQKNFPDTSLWKIVIADNGSTDKTREIAKKLGTELKEVNLVSVPERGVGLALNTSWSQSEADIVGYMDLDLATDLPHFIEAYDAIANNDYDIVYATRLHKRSQVINRPIKREISSRVFNWLVKFYLGTRFSDGQCGFKWLKRSVFPKLQENGARDNGWFFSTELITVSEWLGLKIFELPVKWTDDVSSTKVKVIPLAKRYIKNMQELKKFRHAK
ncbi:MAG: glycosyltransferase [Bacteroidetes bacterium]|nr:MAG: glycosyltransferase [Bacteroidota bacterium]